MTARAERLTDTLAQLRHQARYFTDAAGTAALWAGIAAVMTYAAFAETDEFATGIVIGSVFGLGALGLTLIYGILKFGHFAHGDSMMVGAYIAFFALSGRVVGGRSDAELPWSFNDLPGATDRLPWFGNDLSFGYGLLLAAALAMVAMAALLIALDRLVYRRLRERSAGIVILSVASLGIAIALRSVLLILWGPSPRFYTSGIRPTTDLPFGVRIVTDQTFIFVAAVVMMVLTYLLLYHTKLGKAMRAMADNPNLARVSGIDTDRIVVWTWGIAGGLIAVAGVMLAIQAQLKPELGFIILLPLFAAAILGGIGSPQGALIGALVVGVAEEFAVTFEFLSAGYKFSVAFVILIVILLLRPRGLFGAGT